jgi:hypothetical protein
MVNAPDTGYQPAVAYQGGHINTPQQEPKSGQTQPKQAPAADTQRGDQKFSRDEDRSNSSPDRGKSVDVKV